MIALLGVEVTIFLIRADISPLPSHTPIPITPIKTVPNGAKPVKFLIIELNIYLIPSPVIRDFTLTVVSSKFPVALFKAS